MKKSIIALIGLFTLVACSEDSYEEADKMSETDSGINTVPTTVSSGYDSPFQPAGSSLNKGILTVFKNYTPLNIELEPFGEDMHVQTFLGAVGGTYPPMGIAHSFVPVSGGNFQVLSGTSETNRDPGAPLAVNAPPYSNSVGSIIYDFGSFTTNFRMLHYGKIYYFRYKIFDKGGNVIDSGYIKHKFYNDTDDWQTINATSPDWDVVADVPGLAPMYDAVVMYNTTWDEMCLTNKDGYTTPPLPSQVSITDPATGTAHTLEFTSDTNGIYVNFF